MLAGGLLFLAAILWLYFAPGLPVFADGAGATLFRVAGVLGVLLTGAGVLLLYPLIASEGGPEGNLWATLGAAVVVLALLAYIFVTIFPPAAEPSRTDLAASILAFWVRPVGFLLFAFSLVRADILFGRALLVFLVAAFELPVLPNLALGLAGTPASPEWPVLLFGLPEVQTGLLGALAWLLLGVSALELGREAGELVLPRNL